MLLIHRCQIDSFNNVKSLSVILYFKWMIFIEDLIFNSMSRLEDIGRHYLHKQEKRWVLKNLRFYVSRDSYEVSFIRFTNRKKLSKRWIFVERIKCVLREIIYVIWFTLHSPKFYERFTNYILHRTFERLILIQLIDFWAITTTNGWNIWSRFC
jgi:hypothetical protein